MRTSPKLKHFYPLILTLTVAATSLAVMPVWGQDTAPSAAPAAAAPQSDPFTVETLGREAFIMDYQTGAVLLNKNGDQRTPPASMSKLMTAYVLFDEIKKGRIRLDQTLPVSEKAWRIQGSKMWVDINTEVKVEDLIRGIVIQSGNDACIVVAEGIAGTEEAFAQLMNERAKDLGLTGSHFTNASGWPDPDHYVTARDLALIAQAIIRDFPEFYHYYSELEFEYHNIKQGNRNPLLYGTKLGDGLKTGHTEEAGYGLVGSGERDGRRVIMVVHGLKDMQERADESRRLMSWALQNFQNQHFVAKDKTVEHIPVWYGAKDVVPAVTAQDYVVTVPRGAADKVSLTARYPAAIQAPVKKGDPVGILTVQVVGQPAVEIPLLAAEDVEPMGTFGHIMRSFSLFF